MWESVFGWLAIGAGLVAAVLWLLASRVPVDPGWKTPFDEPFDRTASNTGWMLGILKAGTTSAQLNAWAAGVTAGATLLQAASLAAHRFSL